MKQFTLQRVTLLAGLLILILSGCAGLSMTGVAPDTVTQPIALSVEQDSMAETAAFPPAETDAHSQPEVASSGLVQPAADFANVLALQQAFVNVYEQVNPAVVNITTNSGQGSGFVYDAQGHIVTNNHVIAGARSILVTFSDGAEAPATLIGADPGADLAVVKIDPAATPSVSLTPAPLADSDQLKVGQLVVAIGSPFGLQSSMSTGIISALNRLFPGAVGPSGVAFQIPNIIQTDAAINPGNSGGPLLDIHGSVIGVNTAIQSAVRSSSGVGYAVPANIVRVVVPQLLENGRVATPWLGVSGLEVTPTVADELNLDGSRRGIYISNVIENGPAAVAGLRGANPATGLGGDIIVSIDGEPVATFDDLLGYVVTGTRVGQSVTLEVLRDGALINLSLTLQERPSNS